MVEKLFEKTIEETKEINPTNHNPISNKQLKIHESQSLIDGKYLNYIYLKL